MTSRLRVVLFLVVALVLSACSGLPKEGAVEQGRVVGSQDQRPGVEQQPEAPQAGAGMEAIAEGFLLAHTGAAEGFGTAREFLAGDAQKKWRPDQRIVLLSSSNLSTRREAGAGQRLVVSATAVGEVDVDGRLSEFPSRQRRSLQLGLEQVDGEWRVTQVPADLGLWLSVSDFQRSYQPREVFFAARRGPSVLIPDVRWLPDAGLTTALARAVIGPPPKWLTSTVVRPVPEGTRLQPRSVAVSSRTQTATVTLSRDALKATPGERKALWAAMMQTLSRVSGVSKVEIKVGNSRLQAPGIETDPTVKKTGYTAPEGPTGPVITRQGDALTWASNVRETDPQRGGGDPTQLEDLPTLSSQWTQIAADADGREVAAISGDHAQLGRWVDGKLVTRPSFGTDMVRPAYDGDHGLWIAGRALRAELPKEPKEKDGKGGQPEPLGQPTIWMIDTRQPTAQAQPEPVSAPWLGNRQVLSIAVAPDSQRIAVVVESPQGRRSLLLSGVVRDGNGAVAALGTPVEANPAALEPTSVTWSDVSTLGVLGKTPTSSEEQPLTVPIGGMHYMLGPVPGAVSVVGSSLPQDQVFVVTNRASVEQRLGRAWDHFGDADDIAAPPN